MNAIEKSEIEDNFKKWNIPRPQQDYMVVIHCSTYNHGRYIEDALKGFVMQQTKFPFCAIVIDDGSTDNAPEIIRRYAELYPENIKPILLGENHMQHGKSRDPYFKEWWSVAKYIAMCEGDDYWTDPLKLQKQVDFLEEHEEYVLAFHDASMIDKDENLIEKSEITFLYTEKMCRDWSEFDLMCGSTPPTSTVMYKQTVFSKIMYEMQNAKKLINGDTIIASLMGKYGKGKFMSDIQNSVYRLHPDSVWHMKSELYKRINSYKTYTFLESVHKKNVDVKKYLFNLRLGLLKGVIRIYIKDRNIKEFILYYLMILNMLFVKFKIKTMYQVSLDVVYWLKHKNDK